MSSPLSAGYVQLKTVSHVSHKMFNFYHYYVIFSCLWNQMENLCQNTKMKNGSLI